MIINNLVKYEVDNITSNRSTSFKLNMCLYKQSLIGARPFNFQNSFPTFLFFYMNVNFLPSVTRDLMISKQQPLLTSERKILVEPLPLPSQFDHMLLSCKNLRPEQTAI